ncbi:MAG: conjugal transfer protein TraF [Chlamydiia bacterium]|nr:conjugal transfer protein TraF [Chlamydiia bacterium]
MNRKGYARAFVYVSILSLWKFTLYGNDSWYDQKLEGWYYFEDQAKTSHEKEETKKPKTPEEAAQIAENEKQKLKALLALALIDPTEENVKNYIIRQQRWMEKSQAFSNRWKSVVLQNPLLGDILENPTSTYGIHARKERKIQNTKQLLKKLSEDHFLLFFFQGKDAFSQKASEMITLFQEENHWKIKAVSLDGEGLPNLPSYEIDQGISKIIGIKSAPSFFVVHPQDNRVHPVGAGLISLSELEENIYFALMQEPRPDHFQEINR